MAITVGERAPSFRLPSAQGPEIGPDQYRGKNNLVLWFTKGMSCPFCRQQMTQLARGYPAFKALNAEVLEVSGTPVNRARLYAKKFQLPFPYLSDPDYRVRRLYRLDVRSHSLAWYAKALVHGLSAPKPPNDFGVFAPPPTEIPRLLVDEDMGFFILDREGTVRYAVSGAYDGETGPRPIPGNEQIIRELERCEKTAVGG